MMSNRDRRKGIILSGFTQKSYGKYNNKKKAKYDLNDLVLDLNKNAEITTVADEFDISNDSFKMSDDEDGIDLQRSQSEQDEETMDQDLDISDVPYGKSQVINIAISDNEDSDVVMSSPVKSVMSTPKQSRSNRPTSVLQDISPIVVNTSSYTNEINDKRIPLSSTPTFQRNNSSSNAGLTQFRNRSSLNSTTSKRWSMLSFNLEDKENQSSKSSKRFSISSVSSKDKTKRFSIGSNDKTKRFSISSQISSTSSTQSSFTKYMNKIGNAVSSVSVNSSENLNDSPYREVQPGVVGVSEKPTLNKLNGPAFSKGPSPERKSRPVVSVQAPVINTLPQKPIPVPQEESLPHRHLGKKYSQSSIKSHFRQDSDNFSVMSSSSLRSSRSLFRLSSIFSSKQSNNSGSDNESIRSIKPKSSFNDFRKSILTMGLAKKDSINDIKKKQTLDKTMISLPRPDNDSRVKINDRLKNSSSILSINSTLTRQVTNTPTIHAPSPLKASNYESLQLNKLISLTTHSKIFNFNDFLNKLDLDDDEVLIKFAEASYSEVFAIKNFHKNEIVKILKVIPFGNEAIEQSTIENIIQELKINLKLSSVDGFIKLNESTITQGSYPTLLLKLWDDYNEFFVSNNFRPEFDSSQKFLVLDLEFGGVDLEKIKLKNWKMVKSIFWKIVDILNNAELKFEFEHRDLHWGNIVIKVKENDRNIEASFRDLSIIDEDAEISYDEEYGDEVEVKLIDYTLSRLNNDGEIIFTRLDHPEFFKGKGDYQFDIYRFMRNEIKVGQANKEEIDWSRSKFVSNLYWLHYVLDKLLYHKDVRLSKDKDCQDLLYLYKSLDPRKKKLNNGPSLPEFKKQNGKSEKRQLIYFKDFENSKDVLRFGDFYNLK